MDPNDKRKTWMSLLAKADPALLADRFQAYSGAPEYTWLRVPEIGGAMVRGRMGGTGAPFNLGEMTVTRCSLRLASGQVGHAYVQGRDKAKATQAAIIDALMQTDQASAVQAAILTPLQQARDLARATRAAKAAATKVDFFTMVRGED
jgi:alpha-D-ribose 1-methylphosphonate 5-triphosphate synthase subunit PhnG